jgi:hypothetical protein
MGRLPRRPETGELARRLAAPGLDAQRPAIEPERRAAEPVLEQTALVDDTEAMSAMPPTPQDAPAAPSRSAGAPFIARPVAGPDRDPRAVPMPAPSRAPAPGAVPMRMAGPPMAALSARSPVLPGPMRPANDGEDGQIERTATAPQLRRFIKSRAYVPIHELRRRFGINGGDDEVTPVDLERTRVFVGLPDREGRLLGELLRGGDIGYELSMDPISPIVVGVYPMRPVTRS